jgi:hypothetical protein
LLVSNAAGLLGLAASVRARLDAVSTTTCGDGGVEREDHQDILERLLGEKSERREEQSVQSAGQVRKNVKTSKRLFCFLAADVVGDSERRKMSIVPPFFVYSPTLLAQCKF